MFRDSPHQPPHKCGWSTPQQIGHNAEDIACRFLEQKGMVLVQKNYRTRLGEIDLIMEHGASLVFVEVRYRNDSRYGSAAETVTYYKQRKLINTAQCYLQSHSKAVRRPCRFDVLSITPGRARPQAHPKILWIKDAFQT